MNLIVAQCAGPIKLKELYLQFLNKVDVRA